MPDIKIKLDIDNFGPHTNLRFQDQTSSIKIGMFANNGVGKTFISRAFRLASPLNGLTPLNGSEITNNILTTNEKKGKFVFEIINPDNSVKKLEIKLNKNSEPAINDNTDYFFHVFNSNYVAENLELNGYNPPSDDIQGYILGKSQIDVTKEKSKLQEIKEKQKDIHDKIKDAIEKAIEDLDVLKINKRTKEYKQIEFKNVITSIEIDEDERFEVLKDDHQQLKSMPDGLNDIPVLHYNIDSSALNDVKRLLSTPYDKSNLHKNFVDKIRTNQAFIEDGLKLYNPNKKNCPFCKQKLSEDALKIINLYNNYIQDSEAKTIKEIEGIIKKLKELKSSIEDHYHKFNEVNVQFNNVKKYLPSSKKNELNRLNDNKEMLAKIDELIGMLSAKKEDITSTAFEFKDQIKDINDFLEQLEKDLKGQIDEINALNTVKNSIEKEKLQLNRRLCNARYLDIITEQESNIQESKELDLEISELEEDIEEKESKSKIDKKKEVIKSLKHFLNFFFHDKYSFDEKNFCIQFMEESLSSNATNVLSDGEKGIVAFCYYLATVHNIIEKEEDYKKLFFVIDDPISSMDFSFVHKVAQCISEINQHFDSESFDRFIILTHNLEFMNLLMSNRIISQKYILKKDKISVWKEQLMLPYENHLSDIVEISKGQQDPSHTTPNSIRHVLETICKFENRNKSLLTFMSENPKLKSNVYIYNFMQDLSHGRPRSQPLSDDELKNACTVVIDFISDKYPGQIDGLI